jgi:hypothetical protein
MRVMSLLLSRKPSRRIQPRFLQESGVATGPIELEAVAAWLEEQARRIEAKRVTIEEIILVPGPVPQ